VYNPANKKNNTTSAPMMAAVMVRAALVLLTGGVAVDVTGLLLALVGGFTIVNGRG
jgi:hypothetical protein